MAWWRVMGGLKAMSMGISAYSGLPVSMGNGGHNGCMVVYRVG